MKKTEKENLEYISGVFKGLSAKRKDYILDIARSLLNVQDNNIYPFNNKTVSHCKREEFAFSDSLSTNTGT